MAQREKGDEPSDAVDVERAAVSVPPLQAEREDAEGIRRESLRRG